MSKVCGQCGKTVEGDGAAFCPYCGAKLPETAEKAEPVNPEAEKWIRKALAVTSYPERKKILLKGLEACPGDREIEWELLFVGEQGRQRGQVFDFDGISFFTFGGATSHDIDGGILDISDPEFHKKRKNLDREWIPYRINHLSWWEKELPDAEEMAEGIQNLAAHNNSVDYIVTHCCSSSTQAILGGEKYETDVATTYLEDIKQSIKFKKWFFGHYHDNKSVNADEILIYEQIIRIS